MSTASPLLPAPSPVQSYHQVQREAARWPDLIAERSRVATDDAGSRHSQHPHPLSPSSAQRSARHRRLSSVTQASRDDNDEECLACLEEQIERIRSARQSRLRRASDHETRPSVDTPSRSDRRSSETMRSPVPLVREQHASQTSSPRTHMLRVASRQRGQAREEEMRGRSRDQRPLEASMQGLSLSHDTEHRDHWQEHPDEHGIRDRAYTGPEAATPRSKSKLRPDKTPPAWGGI